MSLFQDMLPNVQVCLASLSHTPHRTFMSVSQPRSHCTCLLSVCLSSSVSSSIQLGSVVISFSCFLATTWPNQNLTHSRPSRSVTQLVCLGFAVNVRVFHKTKCFPNEDQNCLLINFVIFFTKQEEGTIVI